MSAKKYSCRFKIPHSCHTSKTINFQLEFIRRLLSLIVYCPIFLFSCHFVAEVEKNMEELRREFQNLMQSTMKELKELKELRGTCKTHVS